MGMSLTLYVLIRMVAGAFAGGIKNSFTFKHICVEIVNISFLVYKFWVVGEFCFALEKKEYEPLINIEKYFADNP
jgi:hypothetical protein